MERSTIFFLLCFLTIFTVNAQEHEGMVQMNFSTNLYPATPMKNVQSLAMKLWGYVDGAVSHEELRGRFLESQDHFAQQVIKLHSMVDILLLSLEEKAHDNPASVVQAINDFQHIYDGLFTTLQRYELLMQEYQTPYSVIIVYILNLVLGKIKQVLDTGQITTALYAFFVPERIDYSKLTAPLLPPAYTTPVAPIA